ncbi:ATP-grasp domain-containing protein [Erwinia rhapontici]|uniref:ATP-grasp domain-containing protein n=1 Tax=Erwinia rhapontici TaxID=55212 RepID=UPI0021673023|nr:ATP-grasp domain-containing protein [Erwinia rhapontici]MCS3609684.1 putative ATP-grasp superfamily ATP-dependent carboligase [Erwinia rhapontici]
MKAKSSHLVFVETRYTNLKTLHYALDAGYRVSYIGSRRYSDSYDGPEFRALQSRLQNLIWVDNSAEREDVRSALATITQQHQIDAVICFFEIAINACAQAADDLDLPFTHAEAVAICRDKLRCRAFLHEQGIPTLPWYELRERGEIYRAVEEIGLPLIVKPRRGAVSKFIDIIENEKDLQLFQVQHAQPSANDTGIDAEVLSHGFLAERYLSGKMYSVELIANGRELRCITVTEKIVWNTSSFVELGAIIPANTSADKFREISSYAINCVAAINLGRGIFHVEVIDTGNEIVLIEINPRIIGGNGRKMIISSYAFNLDQAIIDAYLGNDFGDIPQQPVKTTVGHHIAPLEAGKPAVRKNAALTIDDHVDLYIKIDENASFNAFRSNYDSQGWFINAAEQRSLALEQNRHGLNAIAQHYGIKLIIDTPLV